MFHKCVVTTCSQGKDMHSHQPNTIKATTFMKAKHTQTDPTHAANVTTYIQATTCSQASNMHLRNYMQPTGQHAIRPTTYSQGNHMQLRQPHATTATTCSQGPRMQPRQSYAIMQPHAGLSITCTHGNHMSPRQLRAVKEIICCQGDLQPRLPPAP